MQAVDSITDLDCRQCPRLVEFLAEVRRDHPDYHARPVPSFGELGVPLLIAGLAPGMHGANRTGRPFTGDHAGILLYRMLHQHGFADAEVSLAADDGLQLRGARIANVVRCLPPLNKPTTAEVRTCNSFMVRELEALPAQAVVLALGRIAHDAVLVAAGLKRSQWPFAHAAEHSLPDGRMLIDSYHCSRYNTQTRRLTEPMFDAVIARCRQLVDARP